MVRRAAGDAAGRTIAAQIKRATENLGYGTDAWRIREAWYSRAGSWSAAALDDLRRRFAAWQEREQTRATERLPSGITNASVRVALVQRLDAIRAGLVEVQREVEALAAEVGRSANVETELGGSSQP